ncbi:MAG: type II toxin-antitoxin system VapC family toxin [Hyphomicrobiales bacterium]|nr:type II toxin-antitoxin system VapC family toxin [Hyphomicrobiales bacterium]
MSVVLDASVVLSWLFADEVDDLSNAALSAVVDRGAWVPAIWRLEVANSLEQARRRGRIEMVDRDIGLRDLNDLDISIDPDTNTNAWTDTLALATQFRLTVYDASYLELSSRRSLPLASLDKDLNAAAVKLGVPLFAG